MCKKLLSGLLGGGNNYVPPAQAQQDSTGDSGAVVKDTSVDGVSVNVGGRENTGRVSLGTGASRRRNSAVGLSI